VRPVAQSKRASVSADHLLHFERECKARAKNVATVQTVSKLISSQRKIFAVEINYFVGLAHFVRNHNQDILYGVQFTAKKQ